MGPARARSEGAESCPGPVGACRPAMGIGQGRAERAATAPAGALRRHGPARPRTARAVFVSAISGE
eukprot:13032699-Alexandrium_andersonii.AAC.1